MQPAALQLGYKPPAGLQGVGNSSGKWPYPRLTGVRLLVEIKYYNYKLDETESNSAEIGTNEVYAVGGAVLGFRGFQV